MFVGLGAKLLGLVLPLHPVLLDVKAKLHIPAYKQFISLLIHIFIPKDETSFRKYRPALRKKAKYMKISQ